MAIARIAELITIGNEILDGRVTDTNRVYLGRTLKSLGYEVRYAQSVDDDMGRVIDALALAASRSDEIFCTGGLGPTTDDLTAEAFAKFIGAPYRIDPAAEKFVRDIFAFRKRDPNPSQMKQAYLAEGAKMLFNPVGTAPGFTYAANMGGRDRAFYFFPGVPRELIAIFEREVQPKLTSASFKSYTWSTIFIAEGDLQEKVKTIEAKIAPLKIGFRTHIPENFVSLMGQVETPAEQANWDFAFGELNKILGPLAYDQGVPGTYEEKLLKKLEAARARLMLVESCTGGLISHSLTEVAGSSAVVWGSQVCYANDEKFRLGVDPKIIERVGAVSEECAVAMADAGLNRLCEDSVKDCEYLVSLSTTGIAGPAGGSDRKPVGLLYVGLTYKKISSGEIFRYQEKVVAPKFLDRTVMKIYMAKRALELLRVKVPAPDPSTRIL